MAFDWIKMRKDLDAHPKVVRIMSVAQRDSCQVVGGLHKVWCLFDTYCTDGFLEGYTPKTLDLHIGYDGFAQAMIDVGWLVHEEGFGLTMPEFTEHNGKSAKVRAENTKQKRLSRACPEKNGQISSLQTDKTRTREEKNNKNNKKDFAQEFAQNFAQFWSAGMRKVNRGRAEQLFAKILSKESNPDDFTAMVVSDIGKRIESGQMGFSEMHPATYLSGRRWEDEIATAKSKLNGTLSEFDYLREVQ